MHCTSIDQSVSGTANGILDSEGTIVIRLVRTAHGYVRYRSSRLHIMPRNSLRRNAKSFLPIPKTITQSESHVIKARLRQRFTFDVTTNNSSIENSIQMVPQHLWDHASKTFITDGYEAFTGIIKVVTSGMWQKSYVQIDNLTVSSFLIFGFAGGNLAVSNGDGETQKPVPWAGIFSAYGPSDHDGLSAALSLIKSDESEQWMPHVIHTCRERVLALVDEGRILPTVREIGGNFVDIYDKQRLATYQVDNFEQRASRVVLSTEMKETPDHSIYVMRLNIE
jgi:hypothetical protein